MLQENPELKIPYATIIWAVTGLMKDIFVPPVGEQWRPLRLAEETLQHVGENASH